MMGADPPDAGQGRTPDGRSDAGGGRGAVFEELRDIGQRLRAARLRVGRSLDDVAAATHVRTHYLSAIENGRASDLPEEVFVKGFLRLYAEQVDLEGAALVADYRRALRSRAAREERAHEGRGRTRAPRRRPVRPSGPVRARRPAAGADAEPAPVRRASPHMPRARRSGGWGGWALGFVVLLAALYGTSVLLARGDRARSPGAQATEAPPAAGAHAGSSASGASKGAGAPSAASRTSAAGAPSSASSASSSAAPSVQVATTAVHASNGWQITYLVTGAASLQVQMSATAYCWTERWADGASQGVQYRLAYSGPETVTWTAASALEIELGNAGVVTSVIVDGHALATLPVQAPDPAEYLYFRLA